MASSDHDSKGWHVLATEDDQPVASYAEFLEEAEAETPNETHQRELMRRVCEEFGYPAPDWVPSIPSRERAAR